MKPATKAALFGLWALVLSSGCGYGDDVAYSPSAPAYDAERDLGRPTTATIQDRTGKIWDVAHAQEYGMVSSGFEFGLGPYAIKPIMNPQMLSAGDFNYPSNHDNFRVMGVRLNGFIRAYPLGILTGHEVANEQFGDAHVAVAY